MNSRMKTNQMIIRIGSVIPVLVALFVLRVLFDLHASRSDLTIYDQMGFVGSALYFSGVLFSIVVFRNQILSDKWRFFGVFLTIIGVGVVTMFIHMALYSSVWSFASQFFWVTSHITWYIATAILFWLLSFRPAFGTPPTETIANESPFVVCIRNTNVYTSLEQFKIYRVLPDEEAWKNGDIRVIDESGEDYLYPSDYFVPIEVPEVVEQALMRIAS
jgi:hypothetical protein